MGIKYHCKYDKLVDPAELKPHPRNANMHPQEQIEALCRFIRVSGWRQVVTVSNRSGYIVAGNGRRAAALVIQCDAPVVYQGFESEADEIAYLLADNRIAELAITDDDMLQSNLDLLSESGFELGDIGFDMDIDFSPDDAPAEGGAATERQKNTHETGLDEVKVFVIPEKRVEFMGLLKNFESKNGDGSIRWQRK